MEKIAKTPWVASNYIYDDQLISQEEIESLVYKCTGSCPGGVTFNQSRFRLDLEAKLGKLRFSKVGDTAELPWGNVSDALMIERVN